MGFLFFSPLCYGARVDDKTANITRRNGGVIVIGGAGKIEIDNTFDTRLTLLKDTAAPAVREALFGKNENRKFYD